MTFPQHSGREVLSSQCRLDPQPTASQSSRGGPGISVSSGSPGDSGVQPGSQTVTGGAQGVRWAWV